MGKELAWSSTMTRTFLMRTGQHQTKGLPGVTMAPADSKFSGRAGRVTPTNPLQGQGQLAVLLQRCSRPLLSLLSGCCCSKIGVMTHQGSDTCDIPWGIAALVTSKQNPAAVCLLHSLLCAWVNCEGPSSSSGKPTTTPGNL